MEYLINFLESKDVNESQIFSHLKCSVEEANILKILTYKYIEGVEDIVASVLLKEIYSSSKYEYVQKIEIIKNLMESGWIVKNSLSNIKNIELSNLELLNANHILTIWNI